MIQSRSPTIPHSGAVNWTAAVLLTLLWLVGVGFILWPPQVDNVPEEGWLTSEQLERVLPPLDGEDIVSVLAELRRNGSFNAEPHLAELSMLVGYSEDFVRERLWKIHNEEPKRVSAMKGAAASARRLAETGRVRLGEPTTLEEWENVEYAVRLTSSYPRRLAGSINYSNHFYLLFDADLRLVGWFQHPGTEP